MPDIFSLYNRFKDYIQGTVVIRLHGPQRQEMEKATGNVWNRVVVNKDDEIGSYKFTGSLENETIEQAMNAFAIAFPVDVCLPKPARLEAATGALAWP